MKLLFSILVCLFAIQAFSINKVQAQIASNGVEVCFTGVDQSASLKPMDFQSYMNEQMFQLYKANQVSCEKIEQIRFGISTTVFALSIGSIYAGATGVGLPITVSLTVANAGLSYLNFMLSRMDCEESSEAFKKKVTDAVCEILSQRTDVHCNPHQIQVLELGGDQNQRMCKISSPQYF